MTRPFFSIVLANFNYGRFLGRALDSILEQSCDDYEIIVVDGGSTDNSLRVIRDRESRLAWWCSERDDGQSDAFNKGFAKSQGQFLTWLNADDVMLPRTLEKVKKCFSQHKECKWLSGNTIFVNDQLVIDKCAVGPPWVGPIARRTRPYVYGPSSFFHRDMFAKSRGFDPSLKFGMDIDLWMQFVAAGCEFRRLMHYCWAFRLHSQSKTTHAFSSPSDDFVHEGLRIWEKHGKRPSPTAGLFLLALKSVTAYPVALRDTWRFRGMALDAYERLKR